MIKTPYEVPRIFHPKKNMPDLAGFHPCGRWTCGRPGGEEAMGGTKEWRFYPLVNLQKTRENHHFLAGNISL